ncbi:MAG: arginine--tRNA ligase, partial [Candidatus Woesearchaeota archaeon]
MDYFKKDIVRIVSKTLQITEANLEMPKDPKLGDFALPCFNFAKQLKKNPNKIAEEIASAASPTDLISKIEAIGPYVNFFVNTTKLAEIILIDVLKLKHDYGKSLLGKDKVVMIEFSSPNTNKPQHLGHVRNNLIGMALSNILDFAGYKTIKANLINDRGIHICKSMVAYKHFGENKEPNKKPDHFVGDFYVLFSKKVKEMPELEEEAYDLLKKWEEGDKETTALWRKMNNWVIKGFNETYENLGVNFDVTYYESNFYDKGKKIVEEALKKGLFIKNKEGAVIAPLEKFGLPDKVVLRADGTSIYVTQDIYLAKLKFEEYPLEKSIYLVGSEHTLYFQQLFAILKLLEFEFVEKCLAKTYGMVFLPEGKLKSREGIVIEADEIIKEMIELASEEIKKRYNKLTDKEIENRAKIIGLGALKFFMLKNEAIKDIYFIPRESISFEGETGPYIQYAYARISSLIEKYGKSIDKEVNFSLLNSEYEKNVIKTIAKFPDVVENAAKNLEPSIVAHYLIEVAQRFTEFYHNCKILQEEEELKKA